jgi:hypothetical protein
VQGRTNLSVALQGTLQDSTVPHNPGWEAASSVVKNHYCAQQHAGVKLHRERALEHRGPH